MLLRFRRHYFACFALLALDTVAIDSGLIGQEVTPNNDRNTLRLGDPTGATKPDLQINNNVIQPKSDVKHNVARYADDSKTNVSLVVATKESPGEISLGVDVSVAQHRDEESTNDAIEHYFNEVELASPLALKIATATMSHVSPFFWFMAGPTSGFDLDSTSGAKEVAVEPSKGVKRIDGPTEEHQPNLTEQALVVDGNEPPRMVVQEETVLSSDPSVDLSVEKETLVTNEPEKVAPETNSRKPTPRPIRIPFSNEKEDEKSSSNSSGSQNSEAQRNKDSRRDQEEPKLDPRNHRSEPEHQGIDALNASKPIANRREIRIDDPKNEGISVAPIVQGKSLEPVLANRLKRTEACLSYYLDNPESTSVRSPWAVMHALLAFGGEYEMVHSKGRVNAIGWMCHNGTCRTQRMFTPTAGGFKPNVGDGVQGHEGQFLAILAQSNVPLNYPIQIGSSKYTVEDLVRYEMATCKEKSELTFKLIGLSYYLDSNKQWRANDGKIWSISKLIQEELAQPIIGAACGGVHRLMGFSFSVRQRQLQGLQVNGQYARADKFVKEYIAYTWQLQNPDGSFSTSWYEGRANEPNDERKVQTTGHMLEWLMYTLPDEELKNPRVGKSIDFLLTKIYDKRDHKWPIGPRGHATRAVALYQARRKEILSQPDRSVPINSAVKTGPAPIRK